MPDVGSTSASSILIEVVLPAPFGPRKPKISPAPTWSDRSATASVGAELLAQRVGLDHAIDHARMLLRRIMHE